MTPSLNTYRIAALPTIGAAAAVPEAVSRAILSALPMMIALKMFRSPKCRIDAWRN